MVRNNCIGKFVERHLGFSARDQEDILNLLGHHDLEEFIASVVPSEILDDDPPSDLLPKASTEKEALKEIALIADKNLIKRSLIGLGYYGTATPALIQRHVFENPAWYTSYTPYQAEISQGRLEALFNFQTLISELTALPITNASLLDEATAAAEAMSLSFAVRSVSSAKKFYVDQEVFPQIFAVLQTRAEPLGLEIELVDPKKVNIDKNVFGLLIQLPGKNGNLWDPSPVIEKAHKANALVTVAVDPMAQVLIAPVGELGVDIAIGSSQRFGVPMGFGGPHAAFFATKEIYKRHIPGRLVGESIDASGNRALRLALQTREQHIRREKATSNICTAQALLAIISSFYAIYHGPDGLEALAKRILFLRAELGKYLIELGYEVNSSPAFDTIEVYCSEAPEIHRLAALKGFNLRIIPFGNSILNAKGFAVSIDELSNKDEIHQLCQIFANVKNLVFEPQTDLDLDYQEILNSIPLRNSPWLQQPVFNIYKSETELIRYIHRLSSRDFSLLNGMIPLGSCTMKLNATSELLPVSWKEFASIHPFVPIDQSKGYEYLSKQLENWLCALTGFDGVSLQPNAGSQGEFAGLLVIRAWHKYNNQSHRNICLIPKSAHGTNPASAVMAGFKVISVDCDQYGNIDFQDLTFKVEKYSSELSVLMITYPSTHGVFEPNIKQICQLIHSNGAQVYLDGANLNAQVGLCRPGFFGADVCHLNLHKTFCIPHGGGGPGIGPIAVSKHLIPFLPSSGFNSGDTSKSVGAIAASPLGSASILPVSWMYIRMMGADGLRKASALAILAANYIAFRLSPHYKILFKGPNGKVAHECILDLREFKRVAGIEVDDIAKRLMDYGFHAPTVSWPVAGTLMIEPTESESFSEINRFCQAMISIRSEIEDVEYGRTERNNNPMRLAPHTMETVTSEDWDRSYSRQQAAFPLKDQFNNKFWPVVSRIDNAFGDRNLVCTCSTVEEFSEK
ncbi:MULTISPECIES: aminomethyl-transferring glycine dehydrogenase [unclassified Prochlorococcus]|uniref:aminomethyl-transferring glycine dehydrogenase n=1 Tax=unclassified Prochlorococcus TaxID=2627481 RepID=UPI000533AC56|nr:MULTISPECIES: aminomethyl-transferring glycine dehydrogenase [unclassified Prochlorococcus]KGG14555.1 Glycine dehydrogenase (decarboxylating) (glycine cleavage system P protein) [Prochlorococcus sp. MIT 0602]KGG16020.1 Glycine dehydrogenase (decarboxylating) (glycine cleavage system P protein) [Prochlorococcus sp. MIT 0603]